MSKSEQQDLIQAFHSGNISRRTFFARATALGISAVTINTLLDSLVGKPVAHAANAQGVVYPAAMGWTSVRDHGAVGDGVTDDTAAIRSAVLAARSTGAARIYFPNGTYLVSDRIEWVNGAHEWRVEGDFWSFQSFQGQSRENTIIKLADNAAGYGDPTQPKAVLYTASSLDGTSGPYAGDKDYPALGEGNTAFTNDIQDLTVDTGRGNSGAVGIDYIASNLGFLGNVTIRSGDGQGQVGLKITRKWSGPALVSRVHISGFDYGIQTAEESYHTTMEHISIEGQRIAGLHNDNHLISLRDFRSRNTVQVIQNTSQGQITLLGGIFIGGNSNVCAIQNTVDSALYVRDTITPGYRAAIDNRGTVIPGIVVREFVSDPSLSLFPSPKKSLGLKIRETPHVRIDNPEDWANIEEYGAVAWSDVDSTAAVQAALDSGKVGIYFPYGRTYTLNGTLHVGGNIQFIDGMYANVNGDVTFRVEEGRRDIVVIQRFFANPPRIEHVSPKTLVIRDMPVKSYRNTMGSGLLFMENVIGGDWIFDHQNVWVRQFDLEGESPRNIKVENRGGCLWILGVKSEGTQTLIETNSGGKTELLGGLLYPVGQVAPDVPAFRCTDASHSLIYAVNGGGGGFWWAGKYPLHVEETRAGETRQLLDDQVPHYRDDCAIIPLYTGAI